MGDGLVWLCICDVLNKLLSDLFCVGFGICFFCFQVNGDRLIDVRDVVVFIYCFDRQV